jgi:hypothetical protein
MMENKDENTSCQEPIKAIHIIATENIKKNIETIPEGKLKWMWPEIREAIRECQKADSINDHRQQ